MSGGAFMYMIIKSDNVMDAPDITDWIKDGEAGLIKVRIFSEFMPAAAKGVALALIFEHVSKERMETFCNRWLGGLLGKDPEYASEMLDVDLKMINDLMRLKIAFLFRRILNQAYAATDNIR